MENITFAQQHHLRSFMLPILLYLHAGAQRPDPKITTAQIC
jgi:hypothetical protein